MPLRMFAFLGCIKWYRPEIDASSKIAVYKNIFDVTMTRRHNVTNTPRALYIMKILGKINKKAYFKGEKL